MRKFTILVLLTTALNFASNISSYAQSPNDIKEEINYEKIINQFHEYVAKSKPEIRKEIADWREKTKDLNGQKKELYKTLSQEAKDFLQQEREFKKKLIIQKKKSTTEQENSPSAQTPKSNSENQDPVQNESSNKQELAPELDNSKNATQTKAK